MKRQFIHNYSDIISLDNLLSAWREFIRGKKGKGDVQIYSHNLADNIILLHKELANFSYRHGGYKHFKISDPKPRDIHKASVKDRLVHHAIYRRLYPFFDKTFIFDSYSCRNNKGAHLAVDRLRKYARQAGANNTKTCWVLKCDIRKFFASVDHGILKNILAQYIPDQDILWLLNRVIDSFEIEQDKGLPLGNLTSQLFVNVYMNEFDQSVRHKLKQKHYIRYADDFVFLSNSKQDLLNINGPISCYLKNALALEIHPLKISLATLASGVDYLGYVNFPKYRVLRTKTKRRAMRQVNNINLSSYLGICRHADAFAIEEELINRAGLFGDY